MLTISNNDIVLAQVANDKQQAIKSIANNLIDKGYVGTGYLEGMLAREAQNSTFLGSGIAIPHGTTDTRDQVKTTAVVVHHFPQGVDWGDDNKVYLAIGIAAQSDQHLAILKQLTKVLSADGVEQKLQEATSAEEIVELLNGKLQTEILFSNDLIQCAFPATDILQLTAVVAGLIKNQDAVQKEFVADLINKEATHLGQGLWLTSSNQGIKKSALALVTVATPFTYQNNPVKGLLCIASNNKLHLNNLQILITLLQTNKIESLFTVSETEIISLLTQQQLTGLQQVFTIRNPHGLHARPGAMLVHTAKQFTSQIQMTNLNGNGKSVNAKSLMKVMTQGVQFGHQLQFSAEGDDAAQALEAIGKAIEQGLGETTA